MKVKHILKCSPHSGVLSVKYKQLVSSNLQISLVLEAKTLLSSTLSSLSEL